MEPIFLDNHRTVTEKMIQLGWEVRDPSYSELPDIRNEYSRIIAKEVSDLRHFILSTVIISDNILDHTERLELEKTNGLTDFCGKYSKLGANVLLGNGIYPIQDICDMNKKFPDPIRRKLLGVKKNSN